jgi:hypothetical protein
LRGGRGGGPDDPSCDAIGVLTPTPPPPPYARYASYGRSPSPAARGRMNLIVLATHPRPSYGKPVHESHSHWPPPKNEGRRSADRRIQPWPRLRTRQRALTQSPLASRRSTAALTEVISLGSTPGRASWNYRGQTGGPSPAPVQRAPRGPVLVPAGRCPKRPSAGLRNPPAGTALAAVSGSSLERPFTSEITLRN